MYRFGIDIGGTKIAAIMLEATSEKVCFEKTIATPDHYEGLCKAIIAMVKEIDSAFYPFTIGIAHPGSCCPKTGKMRNSNRLWLNDKSFIADLEQALGQSIRSSNDGNCFVLSEAMNGAAKDHKVVFGATLGTGLGGGLVVDKKLNHGRNLIGAEWGHIAMPWVEAHELPGPACYCGLHNCLESHLSGTGLARAYEQQFQKTASAKEIVALYHQQDDQAIAIMNQYLHHVARAFAMVINLIDPDAIVLGGGLSHFTPIYQKVPALWQKYLFCPSKVDTPLLCAQYGSDSGKRGAAWLWPKTKN